MNGSGAFLAACAVLCTIVAWTWLRARAGAYPRESGHAGTRRARITWEGGYSQAFQRALDILQALDANIVAADPNRGTIAARLNPSPVSVAPLGGAFTAVITTQQGVTLVDIEVVSAISVLGGRGAKAFVSEFVDAWDRLPEPAAAAK